MVKEKKLFLKRSKSQKTQREFTALYCNLGYRVMTVSYDTATIAEITGISFEKINTLPLDQELNVGSIKVGD